MQSFILDRHTDPNNPTMKVTQDDKIPVYDSLADAQADIANIEEGQIGMTEDSGATEKVVDVIQDGNMNAVTSNAVFDFISSLSGVTQVGDWRLIRLGSSNLYLGFYYHTNITPNISNFSAPLPDGYSYVIHYFGQAFQTGNVANVTGAVHTGNQTTTAIKIYFNGNSGGEFYEVRACCLFQKNS